MPKIIADKKEWTEARFWQFVRSNLRAAPYPPKFIVLQNARRLYVAPPDAPKKKGGKQKWEYQCNICKVWFPQKLVSVDHIIPCGSLTCYDELVPFCKRLWCPIEGFQVLCDTDHAVKTYMETHHTTWEAAVKRKDVILFTKTKADLQKNFLLEVGFSAKQLKTSAMREECYILWKEKNNGQNK